MTPEGERPAEITELLATPDLAEALSSDRFKHFLDHMPVAILVSEVDGSAEKIVYVNKAALEAVGLPEDAIRGQVWSALEQRWSGAGGLGLVTAIVDGKRCVGVFVGPEAAAAARATVLEANAALIADEDGVERYRVVALIERSEPDDADREAFEAQLRDKDLLLLEIQHRVKNNLQMITALIRMEARRAGGQVAEDSFGRLAGRIEALGLLYQQLSVQDGGEEVELGSYLSQIAGAVMKSHATEGLRLNLQVDVMMTTVNVAMPLGLLVNELITNALKYAFAGRNEGVVSLRCVKDADDVCTVAVSDDGVGMAAGASWPSVGKLGALIVRSLEDNTRGKVEVETQPGVGVTTTIRFKLPAIAKN
jgi:two-component sensor histidine kinase